MFYNVELLKLFFIEKNLDKKVLGGSGRMIIKMFYLKYDFKIVFRKVKVFFIDDE